MEANGIVSWCSPSQQAITTVEIVREGMFGCIRTSGTCTRRTDHGFEAEVPAVLSVGEEVEAELSSAEAAEPVRASARVIYRNQNHYGFFFRSHPQADRSQRQGSRNSGVSRMIQ